jgi:hypothetical protein
MVEGTIFIYHSPMIKSFNSWTGCQLVLWSMCFFNYLVHYFLVGFVSLIDVDLCEHLLYWSMAKVLSIIFCGFSGPWCGVLKMKRSRMVGI